MNILGCLDRATGGRYWLDGQEIAGLSADARAVLRNRKIASCSRTSTSCPEPAPWRT